MRTRNTAAGVFLLSLLPFLPALRNGFVNWDDGACLVANTAYQGLGWEQLRWMFSTFFGGLYHPLTWLSFAVDFAVWGVDPFGYHLTNVLLHAANGAVFFLVARRLLNGDDRGGAVAALLFSLHPLRVESVAWAFERKDVLSGFFFLLAVWLYLKACDAPGRRPRLLAAALLCYALSLLSKAMAVTLPLILILLDVYPLKRLSRAALREKIPFALLALGAFIIGLKAQSEGLYALPTGRMYGLFERLLVCGRAGALYLVKTVWPSGLSPIYAWPPVFEPSAWVYPASWAALAAITFALRRSPAGLAAWAYYWISLLPVSGIFKLGWHYAADRYTYLPCLGLALLAGAGLRTRRIGAAIALCLLAFLTARQTRHWRDSFSLWNRALAVDPDSAPAHFGLGDALAREGKLDEAIARYRFAVSLDPAFPEAYNNWGSAEAAQGRLEEAAALFRSALRRQPANTAAEMNLAGVLAQLGRREEAVARYQSLLARRPDFPDAHNNLGAVLAGAGRLEESARHFEEALRLRPGYAEARQNLERLNRRR